MTPLLEVQDLTCSIPDRTLFSNLNFSVGERESVAIVGRSGTGKSTLLAAIMGLRDVDSGDIKICGESIVSAPAAKKLNIRREKIGMVHQDGQLIDELTATENVAVALMLTQHPQPNLWEHAEKTLRNVGVPPNTLASELSGGEIQRTALARALASEPRIILADEPTGSLDMQTRDEVMEHLFAATHTYNAALVIVTHDPEVAAQADRAISL
ncbi:ABC transporter ATP-binding protein [Trueperella bialowiezensis]|uniref:Lipoprotein-releasing system ATP-binding protein LolD n=1 Tax=Trueperella bialowiezensis TaxID=312285 RepID=A0A3S4VT75_9ACTO|nr:ATP-binding cassette domain-containing protein [Trueperella bialowiezensis]VEI13185.1 Lipoprotein-releasing system ATP-binding protein LolD [Trueperella bialowiezensis]